MTLVLPGCHMLAVKNNYTARLLYNFSLASKVLILIKLYPTSRELVVITLLHIDVFIPGILRDDPHSNSFGNKMSDLMPTTFEDMLDAIAFEVKEVRRILENLVLTRGIIPQAL